jgi:hypothetical protein
MPTLPACRLDASPRCSSLRMRRVHRAMASVTNENRMEVPKHQRKVRFSPTEENQVHIYAADKAAVYRPQECAIRGSPALQSQQQNSKSAHIAFLKVMCVYLGRVNPTLLSQTKHIVQICCLKNQLGDPDYICLSASLERELRPVIGEHYWRRMQHYHHRINIHNV